MKYHIQESNDTFAYMQLYNQLRRDIVSGVLAYGMKLPSKRMLAEETGVSVITVEHTYSILCDEGYIESRQRSGYFVIYRESDFLSGMDGSTIVEGLTDGHRIFCGEYHHEIARVPKHGKVKYEFPFSVLAKVMRKVLADYGEEILIKAPNRGCEELRRAISNYLARSNGIEVSPRQIIIGSGAEYLYSLIVQLFGNERKIGLENPSYEKIHSVYRANGAECDLLKLGKDGILTSQLAKTKASVLHITPFRSFPSGVTASASKRNEYMKWSKDRNAIIIEDDFNSEFTVSTKNEDTVFSLEPTRSVIYVNTFTKTIAPSMRIGYMVLPEELVKPFFDKMGFYSCTVPVFEQFVLAEFIRNGDFERHINRTRRKLRQLLK